MLGAQANANAAQAELEKNKVEAEGVDVEFNRRNAERSEKLFKDGKTNYEIALKGAKVKAVELTPEGKWVSPK